MMVVVFTIAYFTTWCAPLRMIYICVVKNFGCAICPGFGVAKKKVHALPQSHASYSSTPITLFQAKMFPLVRILQVVGPTVLF